MLRLNGGSIISHWFSEQDFRSLELIPSGPAAFLALFLMGRFFSWAG